MIVEVDQAAGIFRKRAQTTEEAARLRHEAQVLDVARHPGVVELLEAGSDTLTLRLIDGEALSAPANLAGDDLAAIAAPAATTLADLHDLGVVHGAVTADHILVDRRGGPVLCGLGAGATGSGPDTAGARADVVALAQALVAGAADDTVVRRIRAAVATVEHARSPARILATRLAAPPSTRRAGRHRRLIVAVAVAVAATVLLGVPLLGGSRSRSGCGGPRCSTPECPAVDRGCQPVARRAGVVDMPGGRYRIGRPGDQVVVGRWRCDGALPALLRPATGEIWVWDSWAGAAGSVPARLLTRVLAARSVRVDPGRSGCDRLLVRRQDGGAVVIGPTEAA